jgi:DNA polymerase-3 subunit delta'
MSADDPRPEPDAVEGAPHPRLTRRLVGQQAAERAFLDAVTQDRLHHAWLITGPRGVGKATLAWRIARFLLAGGDGPAGAPQTLDVAEGDPVARRIAGLAEGRLFLLRRAWDDERKRLKSVITVDEARRLKGFFGMSAADAGRRVVIVDSADELNPNAANALLKTLEEPPARSVLLLVSHQPSRLLPTIRSRCRQLACRTLDAGEMAEALAAAGAGAGADAGDGADPAALAELSGGSVGEAVRLANLGGVALYADLLRLMGRAPGLDRPAALALAESCVGRDAEARFDLMLRLTGLLLMRLARTGALGTPPPEAVPGEAATLRRLAPDAAAARAWAEAAEAALARAAHGRAVNLDPASVILDMFLRLDRTAARRAA